MIKRAVEIIIVRHPFFAGLLLNHKLVETTTVPTACIGNKELRVNPDFYAGLTLQQQVFLMCHEVMHIALLHHIRIGGKDPKIWNMAADYVINLELVNYGLQMPPNGLLSHEYAGMSTEQVYDKLQQNADSLPEYQSFGEFEPMTGASEEEIQQAQETIIQQTTMAELSANRREGKLPAGFDRELGELKDPAISWEDQLSIYVTQTAKTDYNWMRPNKRHTEFFLPSLHSETLGHIVIAVDTSGSMSQDTLDGIASEINSIADLYDTEKSIVYCDADIQGTEFFEGGDMVELKFKGGGGTSFRPPFEATYDADVELLIYFTDGYSSDYAEEPDYPVLWVINGRYDRSFSPPYGGVIYMS